MGTMIDLAAFAETVGMAVLRHDRDGTITDANSSVREQLGYAPEELLGMNVTDMFPADERETALGYRRRGGSETGPFRTETAIVDGDGATQPVELRANELPDAGEVVLVVRETGEREQREQYLQFAREVAEIIIQADDEPALLRSVIDTVTDRKFGCTSIALLDKTGTLDRIYGTMEEWCEMDWETVYTPDYVTHVLEQETLVIEDTTRGQHRQHEVESVEHGAIALSLTHRGNDYGILTMHLPDTGSRLSAHERALLRELAYNVATGIHDLRTEAELRERQKQLAVLDRVLRHNLRNELDVITAVGETLAHQLSGEQQSLAESISERSEALLDVAETERKIVELISEPPEIGEVALEPVVARCVADLAAEYPDARFETAVPDGSSVLAIPEVERAIEELVENAVVHNDRTTPEVSVTATQTGGNVHVKVADNGPGIPDREVAVLTREHDISPLDHGTGLALWLVNWIVTLSDGEIQFRERTPRGSVVTLTLLPGGAGVGTDA